MRRLVAQPSCFPGGSIFGVRSPQASNQCFIAYCPAGMIVSSLLCSTFVVSFCLREVSSGTSSGRLDCHKATRRGTALTSKMRFDQYVCIRDGDLVELD